MDLGPRGLLLLLVCGDSLQGHGERSFVAVQRDAKGSVELRRGPFKGNGAAAGVGFNDSETIGSSEGVDLLDVGVGGSIAIDVLLASESSSSSDGRVVPCGEIGQRRAGGTATHYNGYAETTGRVSGSEELVGFFAWTCAANESALGICGCHSSISLMKGWAR
jgi:hypothetical protein